MSKLPPPPLAMQAIRKEKMDEEGTSLEYMLRLGDGKEYLITEGMQQKYPYVKNPEARLTRNFEDIYTLLCGYSLQHLDSKLFEDEGRLAIFRTNCLDFGIQLSPDEILMLQKKEFDEIKQISDYIQSKRGLFEGNKVVFSGKQKTRDFICDLRESFSNLFTKISPDHILDLLECGRVKDLVVKNWSTDVENSILLFVKKFTDKFFRR